MTTHYITPSPLDPIDGVPYPVTFTKADLQADASFIAATASDPFFRDSTNWKVVEIVMRATEGGQTETMVFDCDNVDLTATTDFLVSETSRWIWEVDTVSVFDFDGGSLKLSAKDGQLNPAEFNFNLRVPTASVFNGTQTGTFLFSTTTDILSVTTTVKFDSLDTDQQIFCMDCLGTAFQLYWSPNANVLSFKFGGVFINDFVNIDDNYHQLTCVYNNVDKYIELIRDGISQGISPIPLTGPDIGVTFVPGMEMRISGYDDVDTTWMLTGKIASMELWTDALDVSDGLALYNAAYYQRPEYIVNKTLLNHFLMGDHPLDTSTFLKDNKGNSDVTYIAPVAFDSDLPTHAFPYSTDFTTALETFESGFNAPSGIIVNDAFQQKIASPAQPIAPINGIWSDYSYNLIHDGIGAIPTDMKGAGYVLNFDASKNVVFTFDITELILPVMSGETFSNVRIQAEVWNDSFSGGNFSTDFKNATIVENNVSITLTAADMALPSSPGVAPTTKGTLLSLTFWTHSDGTVVTEGTISIDNLTITNE